MSGRWDDQVVAIDSAHDSCEVLWRAGAETGGGRSLFVLGVGFDPRSLVGLQQFLTTTLPERPTIVRIRLPPPSPASDPRTRALASDNDAAFRELVDESRVRVIDYPPVYERINAGPKIARQVSAPDLLRGHGHLVLDISSLPSTISFPVVKAFLQACDAPVEAPGHFDGQLQVVACENPRVDAAIADLGVTGAAPVGGFRSAFEQEPPSSSPVIWAPTVGEHCDHALRAIHSFLDPRDTTPVLPFPARHPRRADDLLLEHRTELFEEFRVAGSNIIYADERNPFDLYRTLCRLDRDYREALAPLGDTTVALSAHSSKLLSLGVLLAAYERDLPIVAAPARDYTIDGDVDLDGASTENEVACLWLTGAPYE